MRCYQSKAPEEKNYYGALEYKLRGYPFHCSGSDAVLTRKMICRVLEALHASGWHCLTSIDLSRKATDKSVLMFFRCLPATSTYACVSLSDMDHLRLINFPPDIIQKLRATIGNSYMPGIQNERKRDNFVFEIHLSGWPWSHAASYNLHARSMLMQVLKEATKHQWHLVASADVSAKFIERNDNKEPVDVHSWFFSHIDNATGQDFVPAPSAPPSQADPPSYAAPPSYDEAVAYP